VTDFTEPAEPKPEPPAPAVPLRIRLKRFAVRAIIVLALIAAVVAVGSRQTTRVGQKRLDAIVAKLDATEPGWRMEDIEAERRNRITPTEKNGALVVLKAADNLHADWERQWPADLVWHLQWPEPHLPEPKHVEQMKASAPSAAEARALAHTLRDRPTGHYPVTFPDDSFSLVNPHLGKATRVLGLLEFDAALAVVAECDPDRAVRSAHAALHVAGSIGDEPTQSAQFVRASARGRAARMIVQTLAWSEPTEGLAELQAALIAEAEVPIFLYAMRGQRANMHRLFCGLEAERFQYRDLFEGFREPWPAHPEAFRAYRPLLPSDHAEALRRLTAGVAVAKLPLHEQYAAARLTRDDEASSLRYPITHFFVRTIDMSATNVLVSQAELITTAVGIACERFRQLHGRWPHALTEVPKSILPVLPRSPFDGGPLRYCVFEDRIAICCRMEHETLRWGEPPEFEDPQVPGITVGVRLWHPPFRAQPPKPPLE
jgi:hypothetical protein